MNIPTNKKILNIVDLGLLSVKYKSKIYYSLSELFKKLGKEEQAVHYFRLAERATKHEDQ
jgi:hypothetical protein